MSAAVWDVDDSSSEEEPALEEAQLAPCNIALDTEKKGKGKSKGKNKCKWHNPVTWVCVSCSLGNRKYHLRCEACGERRDDAYGNPLKRFREEERSQEEPTLQHAAAGSSADQSEGTSETLTPAPPDLPPPVQLLWPNRGKGKDKHKESCGKGTGKHKGKTDASWNWPIPRHAPAGKGGGKSKMQKAAPPSAEPPEQTDDYRKGYDEGFSAGYILAWEAAILQFGLIDEELPVISASGSPQPRVIWSPRVSSARSCP